MKMFGFDVDNIGFKDDYFIGLLVGSILGAVGMIAISGKSAAAGGAVSMPASSDKTVDFTIPNNIPADDKALFELMFDR